jgi:hypothetical protein
VSASIPPPEPHPPRAPRTHLARRRDDIRLELQSEATLSATCASRRYQFVILAFVFQFGEGRAPWLDQLRRVCRGALGSPPFPPPRPQPPGALAASVDSTVKGEQVPDEARDVNVGAAAAVRYDVEDVGTTPAASAAAALACMGKHEHMDSSRPPMRPVLAVAVAAAPCPPVPRMPLRPAPCPPVPRMPLRPAPYCGPGSCRPSTTPSPETAPQPAECGNLPLKFSIRRISYR